jgi:hypothetical protein
MVAETTITETIAKFQNSGKTFAEFIADLFHGKFIEIYVGDSYEDHNIDQVSTTYPAVFCGKVVAAYRECLIINAASIVNGHHASLGNIMFINERAIRALNEVDDKGVLEDMMMLSKESLAVVKLFKKE